MARPIDAYQAIDIIDEWLDSVGTVMVGKGLSSYGELIGCIEDAPTLTQPNEWISVEDRLPEGHMQVLMWSAKWGIAEAGSYYNSRFWVYNELGDGYVGDRITHWMPLPAPPNRRPPEGEEDT